MKNISYGDFAILWVNLGTTDWTEQRLQTIKCSLVTWNNNQINPNLLGKVIFLHLLKSLYLKQWEGLGCRVLWWFIAIQGMVGWEEVSTIVGHYRLSSMEMFITLLPLLPLIFFLSPLSAKMKCSLSRSLSPSLKTCFIDLKPQNWTWSYFSSAPSLMTIYGPTVSVENLLQYFCYWNLWNSQWGTSQRLPYEVLQME